jgi:hypothetical protein
MDQEEHEIEELTPKERKQQKIKGILKINEMLEKIKPKIQEPLSPEYSFNQEEDSDQTYSDSEASQNS